MRRQQAADNRGVDRKVTSMEVESLESWCEGRASIAVDALLDANLVRREDFDRAVEIVTEELFVRLIIGDYPPLQTPPTVLPDRLTR
jgi:hypothetical protein